MSNTLDHKLSAKVAQQLPEFIRNESSYATFTAFIQAYYEWLETVNTTNTAITTATTNQGALYGTQNLLSYTNVDTTIDTFTDYFVNEFLPNFPKEALTDKTKLIKIAKELYTSKGTPASYQFLFRALYNSDAELFMTRDVVLRASDGKWYVSKSLKLATNDSTFLSINNLRLFGETSKSIATIERSIRSGNKIEVYISNIERLFQSGENVRVVDNNNQTLYFKDGEIVPQGTNGSASLVAKIVGSISSVNINSSKRGQLYQGRSNTYLGDPVVFYGGLNSANGVGARAYVNETTTGSLREVVLVDGSYGYREDPNTYISIVGGGGTGAIANVATIDPSGQINVAFIPKDYISLSMSTSIGNAQYSFFSANTSANANCSLANAFTYTAFSTYPIGSVALNNGGGGYQSLPSISAKSLYDTMDPNTTESLKIKGNLGSLGILGPIKIHNGGSGYANGDIIRFTGGSGTGAFANVSVNSGGTIVSANYIYANTTNGIVTYPLGGLGFKNSRLPHLSVVSSGGANANVAVYTVLGEGATFNSLADERGIGAITSFIVEEFGEDYISAPNVSMKVRDLVVNNVSLDNIVTAGEMVYQGPSFNTSVFRAYVDSISLLETGDVQANSKYVLRTYNYVSNTKTNLQLSVTDRVGMPNLYMDLVTSYNTFDASGGHLFRNGIRTYGNGAAEATARFLNGLIIGEGQYINDDGFPSSFQVLESEDYNDFTYDLIVQKSFSAYKDVLFKMVHPSGTKVVPIHSVKSNKDINIHRESFGANSHTLGYYTGDAGSNASIYTTWTNTSNNIVKFDALVGSNLATYLFAGSKLSIKTNHGPNVYSDVISVDYTSNTAVIKDNVFTTFGNVATSNVTSTGSKINITSLTGKYDLINNGEYSNTANHLQDIVFIGDKIRVYANATHDYQGTVTYVQYSNGAVFITPNITFTGNNTSVSVGRNISSIDVSIYNTVGTIYYPELTTQSGQSITTETGSILILG